MDENLEEKINRIENLLQGKRVLVGFSGGVDSSVVLQLAREFCSHIVAVTADSATVPSGEIEEAKVVTAQISVNEHIVVAFDELEEEGFASNPPNRCYICKKGLFSKLVEIAQRRNCDMILEGTNASDLGGHRPGFEALQELKIVSPLVEAGITKREVREIARDRNLSVSEKPAMACLSSRIPYGSPITREKLMRVSQVEGTIRALQLFDVLRVRDHEDIARIEIGANEFEKTLTTEIRAKIVNVAQKAGYRFVVLDLEGYRPITPEEAN